MNAEDFINMINKQMAGTQNEKELVVPEEKIDLFIDRCMKEKDETLFSLGQSLAWRLDRSPMISFPELEILPKVISRINVRLKNGEV